MNIWRLIGSCALSVACTPIGDLDATGQGAAGFSGGAAHLAGGAANISGAGTASSEARAGSTGSTVGAGERDASGSTGGGTFTSPVSEAAGSSTEGGYADSGGAASRAGSGTGGSGVGSGSTAGSGQGGGASSLDAGAPGDAGAFGEVLQDLPNDLPGSPVQGKVSCFEASYSGNASFEVHTPTASYVLLRDHGNIISITDELSTQRPQWIGYSDYRPRRVAGVLAGHPPKVVTTLDADSLTSRHARLRCESATGDWLWLWDFYTTQATLTVARAPESIGITYRGTPGGQLDAADRLVFASGKAQGVTNSFFDVLPGTTGWLYFADTALGHSLFLIQHDHDELKERYDSLDGDSAAWVFGDGKITQLPKRFSFGLVDSTSHAAVTSRAEFVIAAVH